MITIKEIAALMNVSPTTVANVIHGRTSKVSKENVERIQNALKEYNYVPKMGLEALTKGKTRLILVVVHTTRRYTQTTVGDPFYSQTIGILEEEIRRAGYFMMLYIDKNLDNIFKTAMSWNVAGIISVTLSFSNYEKLNTLVNCPIVGIDTYMEDASPMKDIGHHVTLDDIRAGRQITEYLIRQGFRSFVLISDAKIGSAALRVSGAKQALAGNNLPADKQWSIILDTQKRKRENQIHSLLPLAKKGTALLCTADQLAFEVIGFLTEHGCHIPEDFSICGFDDNPYAEFSIPKLTTMHQDIFRKGQIAADLLFRLLNEEPVPEATVLLPVDLVVRKSVLQQHTDLSSE